MPDTPRDRPHLHVEGGGTSEPYSRPPQKITPRPLPLRDREGHAQALERAIGEALAGGRREMAAREPDIAEGKPGFYLEVEIAAAERAAIDQLGDRRKEVEVVAVRDPGDPAGPVAATVFVPAGAESFYLDKVEAYRTEQTAKGHPKNQALVTRLETVRVATVRSLFTDADALYPPPGQAIWWEVWLRRGTRPPFERVAGRLNVPVKPHAVRFPERDVVLALADEATMTRLVRNSDAVAELRAAKDTPAMFLAMDGAAQREWSDELLGRLTPPDGAASAVCLLDSGATAGHPLLRPALADADLHTVNPDWSVADTAGRWLGHGTAMAGAALYGDLHAILETADPVTLSHRLESVKILPPDGVPDNEPELYGALTGEAIARAEVQAPFRNRVVCMAVTSPSPSRGRPSSWSSAIDQLCFDETGRRLVVVSAGNIRDDLDPAAYLDRNDLELVEDPAQAWNALTVGACTDKITITDPAYDGWVPVAPAGDLSPRSRTSVLWDRQWPIKPEVTFEGGNLAGDGRFPPEAIDDLQLLTTHYRPARRLFDTLGDTSGATALAANMAARIMAARPRLWPETVRGLIVHAAEWTPAMRARFDACGGKRGMQALLRRYGYGVPDLGRALLSASNDLTLMVEDEVQPFQRDGSTATMKNMNLHRLPWPRDELEALGELPVELRLTLSYFVEPNPGERGWTRRHRYASHALRFAVKRATEPLDDFRRRINKAAREEEEGGTATATGGDGWLLGTLRDRGSIHSDWWRGTAAELASRDAIGVFPVGGWWKEKPFLERWNTPARYALIVSIRAPGAPVDIYTPVATRLAIPTVIGLRR